MMGTWKFATRVLWCGAWATMITWMALPVAVPCGSPLRIHGICLLPGSLMSQTMATIPIPSSSRSQELGSHLIPILAALSQETIKVRPCIQHPSSCLRLSLENLTCCQLVVCDCTPTVLNYPPSELQLSGTSFDEVSSEGYVVGVLSHVDYNPFDSHLYSLPLDPATSNSMFTICNTNKLCTAVSFLGHAGTHAVKIRVTDSEGASLDKVVPVTVNPGANFQDLSHTFLS